MEAHELKQKAVDILARRFDAQGADVADIEPRLHTYFSRLTGDPDLHNVYEILGAVKFLRMMRTYDFNLKKVRQVIRLREGEWQQMPSGAWQYVRGGLPQPGTSGPMVYRWEPFQVFVLASVFGFRTWIDTQLTISDRQTLLPTERLTDGRIEDLRRVCTDFTFFGPRKSDKTGLSAFIQVVFFLLEDQNAECYCAANAASQSALLFRRTTQMLRQIDDGHRLRITQTVADWRPQFQTVRNSSIRPLSAGGKTKDGMYAQLCCADEYGSAAWVNGKADMKMLVDVIASSMGPRREPLVFTTTTAGRITSGPFIEKLDALHRLLEREVDFDTDPTDAGLLTDRTLCLLYEPDEWERAEHILMTSQSVRAKVNPMLGIIVQHQFYDDEAAKAMMTGDTGEYISKFLNVYQSATVTEWLKADDVKRLQHGHSISDLAPVNGNHWQIFTGMDFSLGDDLYAHAYLCVNPAIEGPRRFFADMDAWITRDSVIKSPFRVLFERWEAEGWIHIVDAATIPPGVSLQRFDELARSGCGVFRAIGYDPYASKIPINALKAYIASLGANPEEMVQPCRQNAASMNSPIDELTYMIKAEEPWIEFSANPIWAWEAANAVIETDRMDNKKIQKRTADTKIDNFAALLDALQLYDAFDNPAVS